eukprot:1473208-Lingulodinium_polyedra.AAC.1
MPSTSSVLPTSAELEPAKIRCMPTITLAGQEKTFERMGHEWLWRALRNWGLPPRALAIADTLVRGRTMQARVYGYEK